MLPVLTFDGVGFLRQTMNRLAAIVIPRLVGSIADHWGAGRSFVILGAV